jgi:pimeloyl-ACP methyl ester carboxylesterase
MKRNPKFNSATGTKTFVLVPGSWHGGWCWSRVANELTTQGHRVFAVTLTGLGDRKHLAALAVDIGIFVTDIVNLIETEELNDVVLVGHSFGGIPITGAAAKIPDRIRSLVYLDAGVPAPGDSALSLLAPEQQKRRRLETVMLNGLEVSPPPNPLPAFWAINGNDAAWVTRELTPHPFATFTSPLNFDEVIWARLSRTYIQCISPRHPALGEMHARLRRDASWRWIEIASGHHAMVSHPTELAKLLSE